MTSLGIMVALFAEMGREERGHRASISVNEITKAYMMSTPDVSSADVASLLLWPIADICSKAHAPENAEQVEREKAGLIAAFRASLDAIESGAWLKPKEKREASNDA